MDLGWTINTTEPFQEYKTEDMFKIELGASKYFSALLADDSLSAFQVPNRFADAKVAIRRQRQVDDVVVIETTMSVYHIGNSGIANLADLLLFVTHSNSTGLEQFPALDSLIGLGTSVGLVSFANAKESTALVGGFDSWYLNIDDEPSVDTSKYSKSEKTLIVLTSVLSVALFILSMVIIWIAGGWLALRRQVRILLRREDELTRLTQVLQLKPTEDSDEEDPTPGKDDATNFTNPSGILGVNPYYAQSSRGLTGLGIKMTPTKSRQSEMESEPGTPMSEYSEATSAPMGITSMRKLLASRSNNHLESMLGMKKLDYDE